MANAILSASGAQSAQTLATSAFSVDGTISGLALVFTIAALVQWIRTGSFKITWMDFVGVIVASYGATFFIDYFIGDSIGYLAKFVAGGAAAALITYRAGVWQTLVKASHDGDRALLVGCILAVVITNGFTFGGTALNMADKSEEKTLHAVESSPELAAIDQQTALAISGVATATTGAAAFCQGSRCLKTAGQAADAAQSRIAQLRIERAAIVERLAKDGTGAEKLIKDFFGLATIQQARNWHNLGRAAILDILAQLIHWIAARVALGYAAHYKTIKGFSVLIENGYAPQQAALMLAQAPTPLKVENTPQAHPLKVEEITPTTPPPLKVENDPLKVENLKTCTDCGTTFKPSVMWQKRCPDCSKSNKINKGIKG